MAALLLVLFAPAGLHAQTEQAATLNAGQTESAYHSPCLATGNSAPDFSAIVRGGTWQCDNPEFSLAPELTVMRFAVDPQAGLPRHIVTRRSPMRALHVAVEDADGTIRRTVYSYDHLTPAANGTSLKAPLPAVTADTRMVYVGFEQATHSMTLRKAYLSTGDHDQGGMDAGKLLLLAGLCGMLLMPLLFNAAFYRILREPFVLWHTALAISLMLTVIFNSGLTMHLTFVSTSTLSYWTTMVFGLSVTAGGMFAHSFIEPDRMHPAIRKMLPWAALWSLILCAVHANFPFVLRAWQTSAYYLAYTPVLILYITLLVDALSRGSRAAKYQLFGWLPLTAVGVLRVSSQFVPGMEPTDAMMLFYVGCAFEVLATTLGVADRFMALKDQRDRARTEAQMLEQLSERDTLTGLYNRRVLEDRFTQLRKQGFTVMAVLDLDHFKRINDQFGHGVGDDVLRAVASALQPDPDCMVVRMGGEEFVILLRGRNAAARAEHRRNAIVRSVAAKVALDWPVTASMGVVHAPLDALPNADFDTIYRRADKLLYEAKTSGRNRAMSEKLRAFRKRGNDRRGAVSEAA